MVLGLEGALSVSAVLPSHQRGHQLSLRWAEQTCHQPVAQLQSQTHKDWPKELINALQSPPEQQVCRKFFLLPRPHVSMKHLECLAAEQSSSSQGRLWWEKEKLWPGVGG